MSRVEVLEWDTAFFGVEIGQVQLSQSSDLEAIDVEARERGVRCLYGFFDAVGQPTQLFRVQNFGYRLVDVSMRLTLSVDGVRSGVAPSVLVRSGTSEDVEALGPAIDRLVPWSRFTVDPSFGPDAARRMYRAWLARAARRTDELFAVANREGQPAGFITATAVPHPTIGIFSVAEPGAGIGRALLLAATDWAARYDVLLDTVTQARNAASLRFYERRGFVTTSVRYVLHRWLTAKE